MDQITRARTSACSAFATFCHRQVERHQRFVPFTTPPHTIDDGPLDPVRRGEIQLGGSRISRPDGEIFRMTTDSRRA
jgi:hypothetical protein